MTAREPCEHGRLNCSHCHAEADTRIARERWWSGEPGLLLPWYCRDHERAVYGMEPDGLWNGPAPCGATIVGIPEGEREAHEARHRETCTYGCAAASDPTRAEQRALAGALGDLMEQTVYPPSACMDPIQFDGPLPSTDVRADIYRRIRKVRGGRDRMADLLAEIAQHHPTARVIRDPITATIHVAFAEPADADLNGPASGYTAVELDPVEHLTTNARDQGSTAEDGFRFKAEQYPTRGRWRRRKQVLRQLAADLGWPECLAVAHDDQIVGAVLQAGVRLRDWRRFERSGRRWRDAHRSRQRAEKIRRRSRRQYDASGDIPF